MSTQKMLVFLVAVCALVHQDRALGQNVVARAANPDEPRMAASSDASAGLGGQSRNIYSQKLSGHRMMHFGKRPTMPMAPTLVLSDPYLGQYPEDADTQAGLVDVREKLGFPYTHMITPALSEEEFKADLRRKHIMDVVSSLMDISRRKDCNERLEKEKRLNRAKTSKQQVSAGSYMPMRLGQSSVAGRAALLDSDRAFTMLGRQIGTPEDDREEYFDLDKHLEEMRNANSLMKSQNLVEAKPSSDEPENGQQAQQQPQPQQNQDTNINVSSRSVPYSPELTSDAIQRILFGRQLPESRGGPMTMGNFRKKTEPQKMTFMHFG